jgi:hypothetical protein
VVRDEGAPEGVGVLSLGDAFWGQEGIRPGEIAVSILGGPVALEFVRRSWKRGRRDVHPKLSFRTALLLRYESLRHGDRLGACQNKPNRNAGG